MTELDFLKMQKEREQERAKWNSYSHKISEPTDKLLNMIKNFANSGKANRNIDDLTQEEIDNILLATTNFRCLHYLMQCAVNVMSNPTDKKLAIQLYYDGLQAIGRDTELYKLKQSGLKSVSAAETEITKDNLEEVVNCFSELEDMRLCIKNDKHFDTSRMFVAKKKILHSLSNLPIGGELADEFNFCVKKLITQEDIQDIKKYIIDKPKNNASIWE